jgi:hypothetical protein
MNAIQSLENAILERIRKQEMFKKEVKAALTRAFISLPECDSNDEVSNTININKDKFASLLEKLHNDKSLNREAVQQLIQSTNIKDLKRGQNSKTTGSDVPYNYTPLGVHPPDDEEIHLGGKRFTRTRRR